MPEDARTDAHGTQSEETSLVSRSRIVLEGRERRAYVAGAEEPLTYGVAGDLRDYYGAHRLPELGAPVDHIIAAVAG